jgi:upstream activation factor subunit UAF30
MPPKKASAGDDGAAPAPAKKGGGLTKPLNLSPELAAIISKEKGEKISRAECVKRLWAYLKEHNLQDPENKQFFTPDKKMEPVFGSEKIRAFSMSKFLKDHLSN